MNNMEDLIHLFANTGDGVCVVDNQQRIVYWNKAAKQLLGYTCEEVEGRFCHKLLCGRDLGDSLICQSRCVVCEFARSDRPIQAFDLRVIDRDGYTRWINVSSVVIPGSSEDRFQCLIHLFRLINANAGAFPRLKIRFLGPVMVQRFDGSIVNGAFWRRAKVRALFSLLALQRSQGMRRDQLLSALWSDMPRPAGLRNLNTTIYYLRRSLEPRLKHGPDSAYIQNRGERYMLVGGRINWLDVEEFEAKIAATYHETDDEEMERFYREAISLYRGDYLADLDAYLLKCWRERERFRRLYLEALQGLGNLLFEQKRFDEANGQFLKILAEEPCYEKAVQAIMRIALEKQDKINALSAYDDFRKRLRCNLEAKPSQETILLAEEAKMI